MKRGNTIGSRIEELRKSKGITQAELAKEMTLLLGYNVKRETVVQWESNARQLKPKATVKLADYFGVTCDFILRGIDAKYVSIHEISGLTNEAIDTLHTLSTPIEYEQINNEYREEAFVNFFIEKQLDKNITNEINKRILKSVDQLLSRNTGPKVLYNIASYVGIAPGKRGLVIDKDWGDYDLDKSGICAQSIIESLQVFRDEVQEVENGKRNKTDE
jgi:transcriptional regulator with XRE-family HTH domain